MYHKSRSLAAFAGLFLFVAGGLFAQTPRELRFGTAVPGHLGEGDEQWFSVRSTGTGFLIVETTGITDTYLSAYDDSRNLIGENDDGGESTNARMEVFAEAGKNYLFKLRCYDEYDSGPYSIRASFESLSGSRELRPGGTWVSGYLGEGERQLYSVRASAAGALVVETSGDLDTILSAYESSRGFISSDDDGGENLNARLEIFVEAGKTYLFRLGCYGDDAGPFSIRATFEAIPPDTERNIERSRAVPIRLGEPVHVFFRAPSESRWYRYDIPRSGTTFTVQTRGNLDTYMTLFDARGNIIAENDDSDMAEGLNAYISETLNSGTVYIEVKPLSSEQTGRCTLHAEIR